MDNHIRRPWHGTCIVAIEVEMVCQGIKHLSRVREVCLECMHIYFGIWEGHEI
jgi:hypothetical protein